MSRNRQETLTIWSRRLAVFALLILVGGTALFRLGVMSYELPLLGVAISVLLAVLSLFLTLFILLLQGDKLFKRKARRTLVLCLVVLVIPVSSIIAGAGKPVIHDITTDLDNPPVFKTVINQRPDNANSLAIKPETIAIQKQAYPDIAPLRTDLPKPIIFAKTLKLVEEKGWQLVSDNIDLGEIEAIVTTPAFGFQDDVIIRIQADDAGYRVDMRSVSRVGLGDLGANAKRIEGFLADLKLALTQ